MLESFVGELKYKRLSPEEMQSRGILGRLVGPMADTVNGTRNDRAYSKQLWEKAISNDIFQEKLANRCVLSELGHPADRSETDITKACAALAEQPKIGKDGKLYGVWDILNTPSGQILKTLCDYGTKIGISSRGEGDVIEGYDGKSQVDPDTYSLETWDMVIVPAVKDARLNYVTEALDKKRYNKTLKQKLTEAVAKSADREQMKETLENLGIQLDEAAAEYVDKEENSGTAIYKVEDKYTGTYMGQTFSADTVKEVKDQIRASFEAGAQKAANMPESVSEGAEGKKEPGFEYVIYDYTDEDSGYNPIVAIRSTRVEAEYTAARWMGNIYSKPAVKKYEDRYLTFEKVPKGRFKVGDNFYGPFDQDWNLKEEINEDASLVLNPTEKVTLVFQDKAVMDYVSEDDETYSDLIQNCEEVASEEGKEHITYQIKYEGDVAEWYPEEQLEECNTNECADKSNETPVKEEVVDDDNTKDLMEQLQKALKENVQRKKQAQDLQTKLAVSDTEVTKLKEELAHYKSATVTLSVKAKEAKTLEKKVSTLTEKLSAQAKEQKTQEARKVQENLKASQKVRSLTESLTKKDEKIEELTEALNDVKANAELKRSEYNKTLTKAKTLIKEYKALAAQTMERYIESKAVALGVSKNEIKNRLDETYSVDDVDKVCESLQSYQVSISKLPFELKKGAMRVTESKNEALQVMSPFDDSIDEDLLALAKMHF